MRWKDLSSVLVFLLLTATVAAQGPARADNKAIARRYFEEILNTGSAAAIDAIVAADVVFRNPPAVVTGIAEFRKLVAALRGAFPDLHFTLEDELAEGNKVATRWVMRGTQGARKVDVSGMDIFLIDERENQGDLGEHGYAGASAADGHCARAMKTGRIVCAPRRRFGLSAATPPLRPRAGRRTAPSRERFSKSSSKFRPRGRRDGARRTGDRRPAVRRRVSEGGRPRSSVPTRTNAECRRALSGAESARARRPADGAHRRRARAARRLVGRSVDVSRARRMVLRSGNERQQGRRGDARGQLHHVEARRMAARARSHRRC